MNPWTRFLRTKYGVNFPGYLVLWDRQTKKSHSFSNKHWKSLDATIAKQVHQRDLYIALGTQAQKQGPLIRGGSGTVLAVPGLFADIDFQNDKKSRKNYPADTNDALKILDTFPLRPTSVVLTGNGAHVHWDFKEPRLVDTA